MIDRNTSSTARSTTAHGGADPPGRLAGAVFLEPETLSELARSTERNRLLAVLAQAQRCAATGCAVCARDAQDFRAALARQGNGRRALPSCSFKTQRSGAAAP